MGEIQDELSNIFRQLYLKIITELLDIKITPSKPIYGLAPAFPLCLFDCEYDGMELRWRWDISSLKSVRKHILKTWAHYQSLYVFITLFSHDFNFF